MAGLKGSGLVLGVFGCVGMFGVTEPDLTVPAGATSFTVADAVPTDSCYSVQALEEPTNPSQTCTVTNGAGTVTNASITNIAVTCE